MTTPRPFPEEFPGRITYPRYTTLRGLLRPVYDDDGVLTHWFIYTNDRSEPTYIPASQAQVEPAKGSFTLHSDTPSGKTGR